MTWPAIGEGWSRLHSDFTGPFDGQMVLVIVDSERKCIEAEPLKDARPETMVGALRSVFAKFGLPKTFLPDNGPQFVGLVFYELLACNKIQLATAPYHPQSNGLAERVVRTIKEGLKRNLGKDLKMRLDSFLVRYRQTLREDGKSLAECLLDYQIRTKIDCIRPTEKLADGSPTASTRKFNTNEPVWTRSFGTSRRWIPGIVHDWQGTRMVTVD